ncbi:hypothetical protein VNO80_26067 [Phaseolus coccineus]|uniref:Nudix hydrolase domain-containing protein n=1 Tax=Phaseolus coccineus TaxID=3886 RepID=A0AAN9LYY7_PHACN
MSTCRVIIGRNCGPRSRGYADTGYKTRPHMLTTLHVTLTLCIDRFEALFVSLRFILDQFICVLFSLPFSISFSEGTVRSHCNGEGIVWKLIGGIAIMSELVARTGRHQQRYENGYRLVAGCVPFRYKSSDGDSSSEKIVEVLLINSPSGPGLLFPKGGWENDETVEEAAVREAVEEAGVRGDLMDFLGYYEFRSKTHQDEFSPEGLCRAAMFALFVKEELELWPEQSTRNRSWLAVSEALETLRHAWMRDALEGFCKWHEDKLNTKG